MRIERRRGRSREEKELTGIDQTLNEERENEEGTSSMVGDRSPEAP